MKETLDTIAKAADTHERIGAWFAALGCLVVGGLLFVGPDTLPEEIPRHREIGVGVAVFGLVFLVALGAKGRAGSRAKNFVLFMAAGLVAGGLGYGVWNEGRKVMALEAEGVERTLTVMNSGIRFTAANEAASDLILRDDEGEIRLLWDSALKRGSQITLLVHPENVKWVAEAWEGASLLEIAEARGSRWELLGMAAFGVIAGLFALNSFWKALVGAKAPDEEWEG